MVAGAHGNALGVEDGADVVRVDVAEGERDHGHALAGRADQAQTRNVGEGCVCVREQVGLVRGDLLAAHGVDVINGGLQTRDTGDVRRAGLKAHRRGSIRSAVKAHLFDHGAAAFIGRHGV